MPLSIAEYETIAEFKLPKQTWDYYISGCDDWASVRRNREAFKKHVK